MSRRLASTAAVLSALTLILGGAPAFADTTTPTTTATTTADPAPTTESAKPSIKAAADLQAEVAFDKPTYSVTDRVTITATIHNVGDAEAKGVSVIPDVFDVDLDQGFGQLSQSSVDIPAGGTVTATGTGHIISVSNGELTYRLDVMWGDPANPNTTSAETTITITPVDPGDYSGAIYVDKNDNGAFDGGEGLAGVTVMLSGGVPQTNLDTTTDADGRFAFTDLAGGWYSATFAAPDGWVVPGPVSHGGDDFFVGGSDSTTDRYYPAVRPLKESLHLKMAFDQPVYHIGDTATLVITLTNVGSKRLTGITANCNRSGETSRSWDGIPPPGDLGGRTWDLDPGATATVEVPGTVLPGALESGKIAAGCDFGDASWLVEGNPAALTSAKVVKAGAVVHQAGNGETPAPQGSPAPHTLAYTGVSLSTELLGGLALLVVGAALVLATRRRTA